MLVLSRKRNQSVVLKTPDGTQITVMVVEFRGDKIRLGFDAPQEVNIWREELKEKENKNEKRRICERS